MPGCRMRMRSKSKQRSNFHDRIRQDIMLSTVSSSSTTLRFQYRRIAIDAHSRVKLPQFSPFTTSVLLFRSCLVPNRQLKASASRYSVSRTSDRPYVVVRLLSLAPGVHYVVALHLSSHGLVTAPPLCAHNAHPPPYVECFVIQRQQETSSPFDSSFLLLMLVAWSVNGENVSMMRARASVSCN